MSDDYKTLLTHFQEKYHYTPHDDLKTFLLQALFEKNITTIYVVDHHDPNYPDRLVTRQSIYSYSAATPIALVEISSQTGIKFSLAFKEHFHRATTANIPFTIIYDVTYPDFINRALDSTLVKLP